MSDRERIDHADHVRALYMSLYNAKLRGDISQCAKIYKNISVLEDKEELEEVPGDASGAERFKDE